MDHISANKILKHEGFFKRLQDMINNFKDRNTKDMQSNIFAPTKAIELIKHI